MKKLLGLVTIVLMASVAPAQAEPLRFGFDGNDVGGSVRFNREKGSFQFDPTETANFTINNVLVGTPSDLVGLEGNIGGTFEIGTPSAPVAFPGGWVETAPITTVGGSFSITDLNGDVFSATLSFDSLTMVHMSSGDGGLLTTEATVTLTNLTYTGSNASLQALRDSHNNDVTISFTFTSSGEFDGFPQNVTLDYLRTYVSESGEPDVVSTTFSGTLAAAAPVPGSFLMLASGSVLVGGIGAYRRRRVLQLA